MPFDRLIPSHPPGFHLSIRGLKANSSVSVEGDEVVSTSSAVLFARREADNAPYEEEEDAKQRDADEPASGAWTDGFVEAAERTAALLHRQRRG